MKYECLDSLIYSESLINSHSFIRLESGFKSFNSSYLFVFY